MAVINELVLITSGLLVAAAWRAAKREQGEKDAARVCCRQSMAASVVHRRAGLILRESACGQDPERRVLRAAHCSLRAVTKHKRGNWRIWSTDCSAIYAGPQLTRGRHFVLAEGERQTNKRKQKFELWHI